MNSQKSIQVKMQECIVAKNMKHHNGQRTHKGIVGISFAQKINWVQVSSFFKCNYYGEIWR